jgi:hypothetical protein
MEEELSMNTLKLLLVLALGATLAACGSGGSSEDTGPENPLTVRKASCGASDKVETGFQGQVPAAVRAAGFNGYNCNLELVSQSKNEGASWQAAKFQNCVYYDTSSSTVNRTAQGVVTINVANSAAPVKTANLDTIGMFDPWESLKVNERRQLLGAVNALNGNGGPEIDLYDLSANCAQPQLLSSTKVGLAGDPVVSEVRGHEGNFAVDGLTYYGSSLAGRYVYAIDITSTTKPKLISKWNTSVPANDPRGIHGFELNDEGTRLYATSFGQGGAVATRITPNNGLIILDTTEVQQRKANAQMKVVGTVFWDDGGGAQHTIPVKIAGKPYVIFVDEAGSGGNNTAGYAASCAAKLPAWPMARIIDISNEAAPKVVSRLALEIHDPKNCDAVAPDLAGLASFTYGAHYCSVDDKKDATTLACGYFESGIRVFDIRDPLRPKEIAYYNPPGVATASPGSQRAVRRPDAKRAPDWCSAQLFLDKAKGELQTTCQDNGFMVLKFTNGVWPFH